MKEDAKIITVVQGDCVVSGDDNVTLSTVLGSCVAVCLFDKQKKVGGMNHFLLAMSQDPKNTDIKYGVNAMELLINRLLRIGADRSMLEAKLFGGARMTDHARDIGANNIEFAKEFLTNEGIPCISQSLGGLQARRIRFSPTTGAARQLQIAGMQDTLQERARPVVAQPDITLF